MSVTDFIGSVVAGVVSGGAAGWLSSVYAAGPVARRQKAAGRRDDAERQIAEKANGYLGELRAPAYRQTYRPFPPDYAGLARREEFAEEVLTRLPELRGRLQQRVRNLLVQLVGEDTITFVELRRVGVPEPDRQPSGSQETDRLREALQHLTIVGDQYGPIQGQIGRLMLAVSDQRIFDSQLDEVAGLLQAIAQAVSR